MTKKSFLKSENTFNAKNSALNDIFKSNINILFFISQNINNKRWSNLWLLYKHVQRGASVLKLRKKLLDIILLLFVIFCRWNKVYNLHKCRISSNHPVYPIILGLIDQNCNQNQLVQKNVRNMINQLPVKPFLLLRL